jgi:transposase
MFSIRSVTRHAQRFLSSRPNKTDRSDARGIADMMRLGHYRKVHVKSKASQLLRTVLIARKKFVDHMLAIENTIRGLLKVHGLKLGNVHRSRFSAKVETLLPMMLTCAWQSSRCLKPAT